MTTMHLKAVKAPDDYLELVRRFPLVPIRNQRHLDQAIRVVDELSILDENKLTSGQADYLEALSLLVEAYEQERFGDELDDVSPADVLGHLMDTRGMTASDLGRLLGNRALGSKILRGERELSKANIRTLADHFGVRADLFL